MQACAALRGLLPRARSGAVQLEASALEAVNGGVATAESGADYELDILVFATGFQTTQPPFASRVFGRDGLALSDRGGATGRGARIDHGGWVPQPLRDRRPQREPRPQLGRAHARNADRIHPRRLPLEILDGEVLEVDREAEDAYVRELDRRSATTVWLNGGCARAAVSSI